MLNKIKLIYSATSATIGNKGDDKKVLENTMDSLIDQLYIILDKIIIGFESSNPIEKEIGKKLIQFNHTVSTAESLTGGKIAATIVSVAGSSAYYKGSFITYTSEMKQELLKNLESSVKVVDFGVLQ